MGLRKVTFDISKDEAIVLFDFLSRFNKNETSDVFIDQSEQRVLWNIEALLETKLDDLLSPGYNEIFQKARKAVRDKE